MFPSNLQRSQSRRHIGNPKSPTKFSVTEMQSRVHFPELTYLSVGQLMKIHLLASRKTVNTSALSFSVLRVLFLGAGFKMIRISAPRMVDANMQDAQTPWDGTSVQKPRSYVSAHQPIKRLSAPNLSVSKNLNRCEPWPSLILSTLVHLSPKALWEGFRKALRAEIVRSNLNHRQVLAPFGLLDRRGSFIMGNSTTGGN